MATVSEPQAATPAKVSESSVSGWVPANPAPLGLAGFGITTLMLSLVNANLVGGTSLPAVLPVALAFGGIAQLLAGMWEFRSGNTFGAVAFTSYGAFWIAFYFLVTNEVGALGKAAPSGIGMFLWAFGIFTVLMFLCTFASARALTALFFTLSITFILLAIGNSGGSSGLVHAGGYFGIVTALIALYIMTADVMKAVYGRTVLPVGD